MTLRQPTFGHGGNARFDEEVTAMKPGPTAASGLPTDRFVLKVDPDSTDEELEELAEAIADWITSIDPNFFLPEDD
jgi:hypothetical protein